MSQSWTSISRKLRSVNPSAGMPALFTSTSTGPSVAPTSPTRRCTAARSVTSPTAAAAVPPRGAQVGRDTLGPLGVQVVHRDRRARGGQLGGDARPHPLAGAGDERDPSRQVGVRRCHGRHPRRPGWKPATTAARVSGTTG